MDDKYFTCRQNNERTQEVLAATLHTLTKDAATRQAVAAAGGASQLLAALRRRRVCVADGAVELSILGLARDAATADAVVSAGAVAHFMKQLDDFLQACIEES